jgi:hypothetical protein
VYGRITDADTGRGISGAVFLVLQPGITVDTFRWREEEVYAWAETDRRSYFELSTRLRRGTPHFGFGIWDPRLAVSKSAIRNPQSEMGFRNPKFEMGLETRPAGLRPCANRTSRRSTIAT